MGMKRMTFVVFAIVGIAVLLSSCSVYMASKKEGVKLEEASQCKTRGCLIAKGAIPVSSRTAEDGTLIEVFNIRKPTGSTSRAVMHGVLDVATLGLWELAGTPIEGSQNKTEMIPIAVSYNKDETLKDVKVLQ